MTDAYLISRTRLYLDLPPDAAIHPAMVDAMRYRDEALRAYVEAVGTRRAQRAQEDLDRADRKLMDFLRPPARLGGGLKLNKSQSCE